MEGEIFTCKDKSKVAAEILKYSQPEKVINVESSDEPEYKATIFDGMIVANKGDIKKLKLSTCSEYAAEYVKKVMFESREFNEVRVIFDC